MGTPADTRRSEGCGGAVLMGPRLTLWSSWRTRFCLCHQRPSATPCCPPACYNAVSPRRPAWAAEPVTAPLLSGTHVHTRMHTCTHTRTQACMCKRTHSHSSINTRTCVHTQYTCAHRHIRHTLGDLHTRRHPCVWVTPRSVSGVPPQAMMLFTQPQASKHVLTLTHTHTSMCS